MNLIQKLIEHKQRRPKRLAVEYFKRGHLYSMNWEQVYDRVEQYYQALIALGIQKGDRVALYSNTCKEWGFLDAAILACGAVTVPLYHSSNPDDLQVVLEETEPRVLFLQNEALYKQIKDLSEFKQIPQVFSIESFQPLPANITLLKDFINQQANNTSLAEAQKNIALDDLATIIYTSGTSGRPKGVCLHHEQIMSATGDLFPLIGATCTDKTLTFLPLSHVLGRMELWGHYFTGYTLAYAESIDKLKHNLTVIKPTVIVGVPRIFEKIFYGIKAQVEISKWKQKLFNTALSVGEKIDELKNQKKSPSLLMALEAQLAYQLVFSKIQQRLGGNLRFAISGGAPLNPDIAHIFASCNIPILEGYGLTETTGPIFINTLFEKRNGTVGKAIGDVDIQFADDKEILIKSKKVMRSYYKNEEATQEAFTEAGYFKTGDIGELSADGFLKITDRKKDLIKTAGGKFIAPQKLQNMFAKNPLISHIHIHGDKKKYVVALITLDAEALMKIKKDNKISSSDYSQLSRSSIVQSQVKKAVADVNAELASYETIKRFCILDHDFSIAGGELTPSLKMKRKAIDKKYEEQLNALY